MSAISLWASFHLHDCWNDQVRKSGLGSISITSSFRGNLPSPREDRLVLFTMVACVYRNAGRHATHWIHQGNFYGFGAGFLFWFEKTESDRVWWSDDWRQLRQAIVNLFTRGCHHRNLSEIYILQNLFHQGKGSRSISLNGHYLLLSKNPRDKLQNLTLAKQMYPGQTYFFLNQYEEAVKRPFGYLLIDLKTTTQDNCPLRKNLLPCEEGFTQAGYQENIP